MKMEVGYVAYSAQQAVPQFGKEGRQTLLTFKQVFLLKNFHFVLKTIFLFHKKAYEIGKVFEF